MLYLERTAVMAKITDEKFIEKLYQEVNRKFSAYDYGRDFTMWNSIYIREIIGQYVKHYKTIGGKDPKCAKLLSLLKQYSEFSMDDYYIYTEEADILTDTIKELDSYFDIAQKQRAEIAKDMDKTIQSHLLLEVTQNQYEILSNLQLLFYALCTGTLSKDECPGSAKRKVDTPFNKIDTPLFAHAVCPNDISEETRSSNGFFMALSNIALLNPKYISDCLRNNNNGFTTVKLWQRNGAEYTPKYIDVKMTEVYLLSLGKYKSESLWPGCFAAALKFLGYNVDSDNPTDLIDIVIGPNGDLFNDYDLFNPVNVVNTINPKQDETRLDFYNDILATYKILLKVRNLQARTQKEFVLLMLTVREVMNGIIGGIGRPVSSLKPYFELLKKISDNSYKTITDKNISDPKLSDAYDSIARAYEKFLKLFS